MFNRRDLVVTALGYGGAGAAFSSSPAQTQAPLPLLPVGESAQLNAVVLAHGLAVADERGRLRVGDGATRGGVLMALAGDLEPLAAHRLIAADAPDDGAALASAASAALAAGAPLRLEGGRLRTTSVWSPAAAARRVGGGSILLKDGREIPWEPPARVADWRAAEAVGGGFSSVVSAAGGKYEAFPVGRRLPNGRLVALWWSGYGHSPSQAAATFSDVMSSVSDDGGASWSPPRTIYGTDPVTGTNPGEAAWGYYVSCGVDRHGRAVALYLRPVKTGGHELVMQLSAEGELWSPPQVVTGWRDSAPRPLPFGNGVLTPSGRLLFCGYRGDRNYALEIDTETATETARLVVASARPNYSEAALCVVTERRWLMALRRDGEIGAPEIYETRDGGAVWASLGAMDVPASGGYAPQDLFLAESGGRTWICALIGIRASASAPPYGAPGLALFAAPLEGVLKGSGGWRRIHVWPLPDDGADRDGYGFASYDQASGTLAVAAHEETGVATSLIRAGGLRLHDALRSARPPPGLVTLYVKWAGGDDDNPGTLEQPLKTLEAAAAKAPPSGVLRIRLLDNAAMRAQTPWRWSSALILEGWDAASNAPAERQLRSLDLATEGGRRYSGFWFAGPSPWTTVVLNNIVLYVEDPSGAEPRAAPNLDAVFAAPVGAQIGGFTLQLNLSRIVLQSAAAPCHVIGAMACAVSLCLYSSSYSAALPGKWIAGIPAGSPPPPRVMTTLAAL